MKRKITKLFVNADNVEALTGYLSKMKELIEDKEREGAGNGCKWWLEDVEVEEG